MSLVVLSDLDGTVLPGPNAQTKRTRPLSSGPAFQPLLHLLNLGATVIGVTGSKLSTHCELFFDVFPLELRKQGRILIAVEMGRRLYRGSKSDGSAVEDAEYTAAVGARLPTFNEAVVRELAEVGRSGLVAFYEDFAQDRSMVAAAGPHACLHDYVGCADAREPPVTTDKGSYPRVEVREGNSAVVFLGVPVGLGTRYFTVPDGLLSIVDGRPAGNNCFDCIPRGLSKSLVVEYLMRTGEVTAGRAVALGDSPAGNDEGLTRWHQSGIPFISVGTGVVPTHLSDCHITRLSHAEASAAVLSRLAALNMQGPILNEVASLVVDINGDTGDGLTTGGS